MKLFNNFNIFYDIIKLFDSFLIIPIILSHNNDIILILLDYNIFINVLNHI